MIPQFGISQDIKGFFQLRLLEARCVEFFQFERAQLIGNSNFRRGGSVCDSQNIVKSLRWAVSSRTAKKYSRSAGQGISTQAMPSFPSICTGTKPCPLLSTRGCAAYPVGTR